MLLWALDVDFIKSNIYIFWLIIKPLKNKMYYIQWHSGLFVLNLCLEKFGKKINYQTFPVRKYCWEITPLQSTAHEGKQFSEVFTINGILNLVKQEAVKSSPC